MYKQWGKVQAIPYMIMVSFTALLISGTIVF